jgi:hypothetical protein
MYPQTDLAIASMIVADRVREAELRRAWSRPARPRLRFSLRAPFGRRPVAGAVR